MKKLFGLFGIAILVLLVMPLVLAGSLKKDLSEVINKTSPDENISVIILLHEAPTPADINAIKSEGGKVKREYKILNAVSAKIPAHAIEKIAKKDFVRLIEPDYKVQVVLDEGAYQIQADKVWQEGVTGKEVDIAVLDTGIHDENPALNGEVEKEVDFTGEGTDDLNGHGTHVAGIIASNDETYKGIAYDADLFNVKVLNKDGWGYSSDVIEGIEWAVDNGAEVVSMSLGAEIENCDGTDALSLAVDKAVSKGAIVVVAAGNLGPDSGTITTPGCSKKAITIGAVDDNDNVPSFSSRGPTDDGRVKPDLVAPGVSITSTWLSGFKSLSGTSMATPHVSGLVALLLEADSNLNPSEIKEALKSTALDLGLDENTQGAGRVDAYRAYLYIINVTNVTENKTEKNITCDLLPYGLRKKEFLPRGWLKKCPEAGIMPGSFWYGFDKLGEKIKLYLLFDKEKKMEYRKKLAEERLAEMMELIKENRIEFIDELIEDYEENINKSNEIAEIARQQGKNFSKVDEIVAEATSVHIDVLRQVLEKVPQQAKPSIMRAINVSSMGSERALERLQKEKPEKAAELRLKIAERKLVQARDKVEEECDDECEEQVEELLEEYEKELNKTNEIAEIARGLGKNTSSVDELVEKATSQHLDILEEVEKKVPEQAKDAIEKAKDASSKGKEKASEALKKKQEQEREEEAGNKKETGGNEEDKEVEKSVEENLGESNSAQNSEVGSETEESTVKENSKPAKKGRMSGRSILEKIIGWFS